MPKKIILDCDPGHDDAIALLLAHGNPEIELLAITTVMGNSTLDNVTRNALVVATIAGIRDVPIAAGCPRPLVGERRPRPPSTASSGLDGPVLPAPTRTLDPRHAVDVIIETVLREEPGTVTLVPTAALTNIAMAVRKEPRIVERVAEVVLMGGAVTGGNWSAAAEFNIVTDPEAAHIVFGERLAGDDGRARSHAPGPRDPGRRRPDRRASAPDRPGSSSRCWSSSARPTAPSRASRTRRCTTRARSPA